MITNLWLITNDLAEDLSLGLNRGSLDRYHERLMYSSFYHSCNNCHYVFQRFGLHWYIYCINRILLSKKYHNTLSEIMFWTDLEVVCQIKSVYVKKWRNGVPYPCLHRNFLHFILMVCLIHFVHLFSYQLIGRKIFRCISPKIFSDGMLYISNLKASSTIILRNTVNKLISGEWRKLLLCS